MDRANTPGTTRCRKPAKPSRSLVKSLSDARRIIPGMITTDVETHEMPNGEVVYYRDSSHSYWREHDGNGRCSGRIPGISTISKCDGSTFLDPLINWGVNLDREGIAREASLGLSLD